MSCRMTRQKEGESYASPFPAVRGAAGGRRHARRGENDRRQRRRPRRQREIAGSADPRRTRRCRRTGRGGLEVDRRARSEEHTSELQSLMRISYAGFCLKKKKKQSTNHAT